MKKGTIFFILCNIIQQYCDTISGGGGTVKTFLNLVYFSQNHPNIKQIKVLHPTDVKT